MHVLEIIIPILVSIFPRSENITLNFFSGHAPSSAATNQFLHYGQEVNSGRFRQYDYGPTKNLFKYKRFTPPDYNLKNVKAPVAVYYAHNDWLATKKDIHILIERLPNVVKSYLIPHKQFNR